MQHHCVSEGSAPSEVVGDPDIDGQDVSPLGAEGTSDTLSFAISNSPETFRHSVGKEAFRLQDLELGLAPRLPQATRFCPMQRVGC